MRVRIRLKSGPRVRRGTRKNRRVALACAALLTPAALGTFVLGVWRIAADLGWASQFAIPEGVLSHWQVWIAFGSVLQLAALLLNRYGTASDARDLSPRETALSDS